MRFVSLFSLCVAVGAAMPTENIDMDMIKPLAAGMDTFSINLFKEIHKNQNGENSVMSPLSASVALSMAAKGARGNTAKQMHEVLSLPTDDTAAHNGFKNLLHHFNSLNRENVSVELANKMYLAKDFEVNTHFREMTSNVFDSATDLIDIDHPSEAADAINNYVETKTHGKIKKMIEQADINGFTRMILLNTLYFKSAWKKQFNAALTRDQPFSLDKINKKDVLTMYKEGDFQYGELPDLHAKFVELPFVSENIKMVIIMPDDEEGLGHMINNLESYNSSRLAEAGKKTHLHLHVPKFKIERDIGLKNALIHMGMRDMFDDSADFSGISEKRLTVDKILQKATIDVNEGGCEATAATMIEFALMSARVPQEMTVMKVDKPFFYKIVAADIDVTLFMGTVAKP